MKKPTEKKTPKTDAYTADAYTADALRAITTTLDALDKAQRLRVVRAACAFYGIPVPKDPAP